MGGSSVSIPEWLLIAAPIAAVLSALAAVVSATMAYGSNRRAATRQRENRVRELSLLGNKVVAASERFDVLADDLKRAYETLVTFTGQGGGTSQALQVHLGQIEKVQAAVSEMGDFTSALLARDINKFTDEQINQYIMQLEGYLASAARREEQYHFDFGWVDGQNQIYRVKAANWEPQVRG